MPTSPATAFVFPCLPLNEPSPPRFAASSCPRNSSARLTERSTFGRYFSNLADSVSARVSPDGSAAAPAMTATAVMLILTSRPGVIICSHHL